MHGLLIELGMVQILDRSDHPSIANKESQKQTVLERKEKVKKFDHRTKE